MQLDYQVTTMTQTNQIACNVSLWIQQNRSVAINAQAQITVNQQGVIQNMFSPLKMVQDFALNVWIIAIPVN